MRKSLTGSFTHIRFIFAYMILICTTHPAIADTANKGDKCSIIVFFAFKSLSNNCNNVADSGLMKQVEDVRVDLEKHQDKLDRMAEHIDYLEANKERQAKETAQIKTQTKQNNEEIISLKQTNELLMKRLRSATDDLEGIKPGDLSEIDKYIGETKNKFDDVDEKLHDINTKIDNLSTQIKVQGEKIEVQDAKIVSNKADIKELKGWKEAQAYTAQYFLGVRLGQTNLAEDDQNDYAVFLEFLLPSRILQRASFFIEYEQIDWSEQYTYQLLPGLPDNIKTLDHEFRLLSAGINHLVLDWGRYFYTYLGASAGLSISGDDNVKKLAFIIGTEFHTNNFRFDVELRPERYYDVPAENIQFNPFGTAIVEQTTTNHDGLFLGIRLSFRLK